MGTFVHPIPTFIIGYFEMRGKVLPEKLRETAPNHRRFCSTFLTLCLAMRDSASGIAPRRRHLPADGLYPVEWRGRLGERAGVKEERGGGAGDIRVTR